MIKTRFVGTIAVLDVHGALAAVEGDPGLRPVIRLALDNGARTIIVNLQGVTAIDSSGVSQLASGHLTAINSGGRLKLCNLSQKLKDVFAITRLHAVFDAYDTEADAIASADS
jgi:anti-sigma B factor antagonist